MKSYKSIIKKIWVGAVLSCVILMGINSCDYLDVVPDNVPTLDHAFANRYEAERYLYTCYSWLPEVDMVSNILFTGADDTWTWYENHYSYQSPWKIARGDQNVVSPLVNAWNGENHMKNMFKGIRDCNLFIEQISDLDKVQDLQMGLRKRWIAEAKFLKAYYHFYLFRMYGPIPITDVNIPVSASHNEVSVKRDPVDKVVDYIARLCDEAAAGLPISIENQTTEAGRVTKGAALTLKAKLLVTAASPLFNGNPDYVNFKDKDGVALFNSSYDKTKWERAVVACEAALDSIPGVSLYYFTKQNAISETTWNKMNYRGAITEKWNSELIWGRSVQGTSFIQGCSLPPNIDTRIEKNTYFSSYLSVTLGMAERYYSKNGVPIDEDKLWNYANRYQVATADEDQKYNIKQGYQTAKMNLNRENRFYASLSFDGSLLYMANNVGGTEDNSWLIDAKFGGRQGKTGIEYYNLTGYWPSKLCSYKFEQTSTGSKTEQYPWPEMRLADLYLLYAEALNEIDLGNEAIHYVNLIRARSGLNGVKESWEAYSKNPNKYKSKDGLREIIHQEREIELAFEGHRIWDLRRWKKAEIFQNKPVYGWNIYGKTPADYYKVTTLYNQDFVSPRDYLWPIKEYEMLINKNLVQNPGWN